MAKQFSLTKIDDLEGNKVRVYFTLKPDGKSKIFECPALGCAKTYASVQNISAHLFDQHGWAHLGVPCEVCGVSVAASVVSEHTKKCRQAAAKAAAAPAPVIPADAVKANSVEDEDGVRHPLFSHLNRYYCPIPGCGETYADSTLSNICAHLFYTHGWRNYGGTCSVCHAEVALKTYKINHVPKCRKAHPDATFTATPLIDPVGGSMAEHNAYLRTVIEVARGKPGVDFVEVRDAEGNKCYQCNLTNCMKREVFIHAQAWVRHRADITGERHYKCTAPGCSFVGADSGDLSHHKKACNVRVVAQNVDGSVEVIAPGRGLFPCDACGATFPLMDGLKQHRERCNPARIAMGKAPQSPVRCLLCGEEYTKSSIKDHIKRCSGERLYPCDVPGCTVAPFATKSDLTVHRTVHIATKECVCTAMVDERADPDEPPPQKRHCGSAKDAGRGQRPCGKAFASNKRLLQHQAVVHAPRRFSCDQCDFIAATKKDLDSHFCSMHVPPETWTCMDCFAPLGLALHKQSAYLDHRFTVHGEGTAYSCPKCDMVFGCWYSLHRHSSFHTLGADLSSYETQLGRFLADPDGELMTMTEPFTPVIGSQFTLQGCKALRFDYVIQSPDGRPVVLIEYDGGHHFKPFSKKPELLFGFLTGVHRDLVKARAARSAGIPLLRFTGTRFYDAPLRTRDVILALHTGKWAPPRDFSDYVCGDRFVQELVPSIRRKFPRGTQAPSVDDIRRVLATFENYPYHELDPAACLPFKDAVACMFIRAHRKERFEALDASDHDVAMAAARLILAMPEFAGEAAPPAFVDVDMTADDNSEEETNGGSAASDDAPMAGAGGGGVGVLSWLPGGDRVRPSADVLRAAHEDALRLREFIQCPLCVAKPFKASTKGSGELLSHFRSVHSLVHEVRCALCPATFTDMHQRDAHNKAVHTGEVHKKWRCGTCADPKSYADFAFLLRHFNDAHHGQFPRTCTLICKCGLRFQRHAQLFQHVRLGGAQCGTK